MLATDAFHPGLKTHKLKGRLKDCWSCTVEYDLRIVFEIIRDTEEATIFIETFGSHDDVY